MKSIFQILFIFLVSISALSAQNFTSLDGGVKTVGEVMMSAKDTINNLTYIGGLFKSVNGIPVNNIAMFDGTNWSELGAGIEGTIITMKVINGELYVAGNIQSAGGMPVNNIAKWNGTSWSGVGQGLPYVIRELEYFQNKIYITGFLVNTPTSYLVSFDGTSWSSNLGSFDRNVNGIFVKNNDLIIYGYFQLFNTDSVNGIISYNGSSFYYFPKSFRDGVHSAELIDTTIYAMNPSQDTISFFNGSLWTPYYIDSTSWNKLVQLFSYHDSLYFVVDSNYSGATYDYLVLKKLNTDLSIEDILKIRKDHSENIIRNILTVNDEIHVTGFLDHIEDTLALSYFLYDGSLWTNPGKVSNDDSYYDPWINSFVYSIVKDSSTGDIYAAGLFLFAGITYSPNVARWDGTSWHAMSTGLSDRVYKLVFFNNELYAFGNFDYAGSTWVGKAAKWDGSSWQPFGTGFSGNVFDAVVFENELYACGEFRSVNGVSANFIAKYDGTNWTSVGDNLLDAPTVKIVVFNNQLTTGSSSSYGFQSSNRATCAFLDTNNQWQEKDFFYSDGCTSMIVYHNQLFLTDYNYSGTLLYRWNGYRFIQIYNSGVAWRKGKLLEYKDNLFFTISNQGFFKFDSVNTTFNSPLSNIEPLTILEDGTTDYFGGYFPNLYIGSNVIPMNCIARVTPNPPTVSFTTNTDTICERENIYYQISSTDPFATYSWHFGGGTPDTLHYPDPIIQYFTPGSFSTYLVAENLIGADTIYMNGTITVLPCLSSTNEIDKDAITVFPNPFTEIIFFNSENKINNINLTDVTGKIIYQQRSETNTVDLSFLDVGIYFISLRSENTISTFRIIKQ